MTDLLETREEVTPIDTALAVPFQQSMVTRVARFGFEYEMLPHDGGDDDDIYVDDDDVWSDDHSECNCQECIDNRRDDRYDRLRAERSDSGYGDASDLISAAYQAGLIRHNDQHSYHCRCAECQPTRTGHLLTAQEDCTVGVEFVSRILDLNRDWDPQPIHDWVGVMDRWKRDGRWMPDGVTSCGNHVHVSTSGVDHGRGQQFTPVERTRARQHINAVYAAYDWTRVADGGAGRIRDYNSKPQKAGYSGNWVADRGYVTFEHRVWNTPAVPERLWAHLGISIGLTRWAFALATTTDVMFWTPRASWYGDESAAMSDETWDGFQHNLDGFRNAIAAYIPEFSEFDLAREVIGNLAPGN